MKKDKLKKIADYSNNANNFKAKKSQQGGKEKSVVCPDFGMTHANLVGTLSNVPEYLFIDEILQMEFYYPRADGTRVKKPFNKCKQATKLIKNLLSYIAYYTIFSKFDNVQVEVHNETIREFLNGKAKYWKSILNVLVENDIIYRSVEYKKKQECYTYRLVSDKLLNVDNWYRDNQSITFPLQPKKEELPKEDEEVQVIEEVSSVVPSEQIDEYDEMFKALTNKFANPYQYKRYKEIDIDPHSKHICSCCDKEHFAYMFAIGKTTQMLNAKCRVCWEPSNREKTKNVKNTLEKVNQFNVEDFSKKTAKITSIKSSEHILEDERELMLCALYED